MMPLLLGLWMISMQAGLKAFGPTKAAAELEWSKDFAKEIMVKYDVPTAAYGTFSDFEGSQGLHRRERRSIVVKADGWPLGKVSSLPRQLSKQSKPLMRCFWTINSVIQVRVWLSRNSLTGNFLSLPLSMGISSTSCQRLRTINVPMTATKGPNTGGMGAYAPVPHLPQSVVDTAVETIVKPVLEGMIKEGRPYLGVLYAGLILTADGPKGYRIQRSFWRSETQIHLASFDVWLCAKYHGYPRMAKSRTSRGRTKGVTLGVVVASNGYPLAYEEGCQASSQDRRRHHHLLCWAKFAENGQTFSQMADVSICSLPQQTPSKTARNHLQRTRQTKHRRPLLPNGYPVARRKIKLLKIFDEE